MQTTESVPAATLRPIAEPNLTEHARRGLEPAEALSRLGRFGRNELPPPRREGWLHRTGRQFLEPMALLLLTAAAVTWFGLGERVDSLAILTIVSANATIAFVQEGKAASALEALRKMETPRAVVRRGGRVEEVPAADVVPGDVVLLTAGDRIPADALVVDAYSLEVDESMLTGESLPVAKDPGAVRVGGAGIGEQPWMVFSGTLVVHGSGATVVTRTGADTRLGAIAKGLDEREPQTPLQRELRRLTGRLGAVAVGVAFAVFGLTMLRLGFTADGAEQAFLSAAALAVAAVPEGLPTVVTVGLALGVRRMAGHGAIVRRLPAVETLGSTTVILTDKTGTLTENTMRLDSIWASGCFAGALENLPDAVADSVAEVLALNNDATIDPPTGDPMEIALLRGVGRERCERIRAGSPRLAVVGFDSTRKRMTTVHAFVGSKALMTMKGAPEVVVPLCGRIMSGADELPLTDEAARAALETAERAAASGSRVLALARKVVDAVPGDPSSAEQDLVLVGLAALRDPVRPEAGSAVAEAAAAGLRILMVTGDHPGTARAVAAEVGIASSDVPAVTGSDLRAAGIPDDPLSASVYARVDPDEKLALVVALQKRGQVVAVTGDGVNDAPALRRADIGVAMGRSGSDVAREAADMVVTDDNLATIVTAVREGRGIYDNIRKVVEYLVAGNLSEILVVVTGLLFFPGLGVPLLPLQLLWINLLTDGFPALALGVDAVDPGLMARPPRPRADHLLSLPKLGRLLARAVLIAGAAVGSLMIVRFAWHEPWSQARSTMFSVLMTAHLLYAYAVRHTNGGWRVRWNPWLLGAVGTGIGLQVLVVGLPALQPVFGTVSPTLREWVLVAGAGILPALIMTVWRTTGRASGGRDA